MDLITSVFPGLDTTLRRIAETRLETVYDSMALQGLDPKFPPGIDEALVKVLLFSDYVTTAFTRNPRILADLIDSEDLFTSYSENTYKKRLGQTVSRDMDPETARPLLLQTKVYESVRIAWRDLTGTADLLETLRDLSLLAEAIVETAVTIIHEDLCKTYGNPTDKDGNIQQIIVLGMGKLGAGELNFSSDIDLIFVFPKDGDTLGKEIISNEVFFTKLCRRFIKLFSDASREINFYRVDTRLRPYGDSGPLAMSGSAFEEYYQAQGREWERYAMIKARPIAGDIEAGRSLLKSLNAFVFRRYFDYGSFDSFRDMKRRISLQVKSKRLENNIKLGAGGIREIEFFGQLFQLIRGGVEPRFQEVKILKVLELLERHAGIDKKTHTDLEAAYVFLRRVENRLQEWADLQTHNIPDKDDRKKILALSMGYDTWEDFYRDLEDHRQRVHHHFNQLLVTEEEEKKDIETYGLKELWVNINDPQAGTDASAIKGFCDPERVLGLLRSLESHPNTKRLTANGRNKLARLIPLLLKNIAAKEDAEDILVKLIDLVITIERRTCYLSLLIENKGALETLVTLAQKSPWIVSFLSDHPALLDELMHPGSLYSPPNRKALEKEMETRMAGVPREDLEIILEELCIFRQVNMLRVAAADVSGNYPLMKVSDHLTWIAETVLKQVLEISWGIVAGKYGVPGGISGKSMADCGFAIIAYGKVGGLEMGYKSDIDIVFLHRGEPGVTTGRDRQIETVLFYSNLGQRVIHALTMHTPAGSLYGADMRLRPGGSSGTIVSHINAFETYLEKEAWTWEHQALIRARPVAGDVSLCAEFEEIRKRILTLKRPDPPLKEEVSKMRERMRQDRLKVEKGIVDLKQSKGCIVDIEFLVQYLILKHSHAFPDLTLWTDNVRLLESLDAEGIITGCESERLQDAYIRMRKAVHRFNLQEKHQDVPEGLFRSPQEHVIKIYDTYLDGS